LLPMPEKDNNPELDSFSFPREGPREGNNADNLP
jgi:hypothetical protein